MSALVLKSANCLIFEDRPEPDIVHDDEVKVRVKMTGICGSDVHYLMHGRIGSFVVESPMVLGHESAGEVVAVGRSVGTLQIGDRVAMEPGVLCRRCQACKHGKYNLCSNMKFAATPPCDGTLQDYYVVPEDLCYKLPESMSLEEGALMEPLSVAVHMVKQANIMMGDSMVIFGAGPVGLLCCAVAKAYGASKVIAVDISQTRVAFAQNYAATDGIVPNLENTPQQNASCMIERFGLGQGADRALDASGAASATATAIHVLRPGGTFVQGGMGPTEIIFPILTACVKEIKIHGSFRYGPGDYAESIGLVSSGRVHVKGLVTHRFAFHDAEQAFQEVRRGNDCLIKAMICSRQ